MDSSADRNLTSGWTIRRVDAIDEYHACEELQRRAWEFGGDLDIVPLTQLVAAQKAGGVVLGGFDASGALHGFCYGFVGRRDDGELLHYSHMTAVDSEARSSGLGAALKWAQREAVLEQGIDWMVWTYDPLESLNGYFNFSKLGVVACRYFEDLYGETSSGLHQGAPTDRLLAEWPLASGRVAGRLRGAGPGAPDRVAELPILLRAVTDARGLEAPSEVADPGGHPAVALEIPESIQALKAADPALGMAWRMATREAMGGALAAGYHVAECVRAGGRTFYELRVGEPCLDDEDPQPGESS